MNIRIIQSLHRGSRYDFQGFLEDLVSCVCEIFCEESIHSMSFSKNSMIPMQMKKKNADCVLKSLDFYLMSLEVITKTVKLTISRPEKKKYLDND